MTTPESTEDQIRAKIVAHVTNLLDAHWSRIVEIRDEDATSEVAIGFVVHVDTKGKRPVVKTKVRYARTFTDEAEEALPDLEQEEFPLSN